MSVILYILVFLFFLVFFIFSYKTISIRLFRWALVFHFIILLSSAIYHTKRYDNIYYPPGGDLKIFTLAKDCYYPNPPLATHSCHPNPPSDTKVLFQRLTKQLKNMFFYAPHLGQTKQYLINALISKSFGPYFYNGYFFACCLHGTIHLGALLILFKLLESYQLSPIWRFSTVIFLSYSPYVIGLHGIPLCEAPCWFATAMFSFCFFKNYSFHKTFLSALLVGASHKAMAIFPLLFYGSVLKNLSLKRVLIFLCLAFLIGKTVLSSWYYKYHINSIISNRHNGNSTIIQSVNQDNTLTCALFINRVVEGLFAPIVTRHGFFKVNYSTIYAVIIASCDVAMFIFLLSCMGYSLVSKFKSFEPDEKKKVIYFLSIIIILLSIIGVAGVNYLTQIRHRSKVLILLLALLGFLNQKKPAIESKK